MNKIEKPSCNLEEHLNSCIEKCRNDKQKLMTFIPRILAQTNSYDNKAMDNQIFTLTPLDQLPFDSSRLTNLYETHMVKKTSVGRKIYDNLILSAKGCCPFCSHGVVSTLDHYLPKSVINGFPELSIVPINLVPCCSDCNRKKSEKRPTTANEQFIHPYYDDIGQEQWLSAKVNYDINNEVTILFYVDCPEIGDEILKARIKYHFKTLELEKLYSQQAATELSGIKYSLDNIFQKGGAVKEYLFEQAESWRNFDKNSWQAAMYYALANDERFYSKMKNRIVN